MKQKVLFTLLALFMSLSSWAAVDPFVDETSGLKFRVTSVSPAEVKVIKNDPVYSGVSYSIPATVTYNEVQYSVTSIGDQAFNSCTSLTSVTIPASVTSIGSEAFKGCNSMPSITIPASVESIGGDAFQSCSSLTSVTIPASVETIGDCAFQNCSSLTSVTCLRASVPSLGSDAFQYCSKLTTIYVPDATAVKAYKSDDAQENKGWTEGLQILITPFPNGSCGENVQWVFNPGTGVLTIYGTGAMANYDVASNKAPWADYTDDITTVVIENGVTSIGDNAFAECSSLTTVTIPASVTSIGRQAFSWCSNLTSVTIPNSVTSIGESAFFWCSSLTSVEIPNSVTNIDGYAFSDCSSLASVTCLATSVPSLGMWAFDECTALTTIYVPVGSLTAYQSAWNGKVNGANISPCTPFYYSSTSDISGKFVQSKFTGADADATVTSLGGNDYVAVFPGTVTSIGVGAFANCTSLTSINIPNSVESIGEDAFIWCSSLTSVTIPNSVTSIGNNAFNGCQSLTTVTFEPGSKLTSIGEHAFYYCTSLTSVNIPASVTSIGKYAFCNCSQLASVTLKSFPTFGTDVFDGVKAGCTYTLALDDAEHPFIATVTSNAPDFTTKTYTRTVAEAGKYQALYVPFALSVTTNLADFDVYSLGTITSTSVELTPLTSGSTTANTPYIIKAKAENAKINVSDFTLNPSTYSAPGTPFDVVGTYQTVKYGDVSGDWYALKDGKFMKAADGAYLNPMRFYLKTTSSAKDCLEFVFGEETTGVASLSTVNGQQSTVNGIYNLAGQKVGADYKGIIIVNGKKYLNR